MSKIYYKKGYKYQLVAYYECHIGIIPTIPIDMDWVKLDETGLLRIKKYYAWDGPSGPSVDTKNFMRGSLLHDALYQLIKEGLLSPECRSEADNILRKICIEDGMSSFRAWYVYTAVRAFGKIYSDNNKEPILVAP